MHYLYPFLLCLIPIHSIYAQNISELSVKDYLQTCAVISLIALAGCAGLYFLTGNAACAELIFTVNFFLLLYANYVFICVLSEKTYLIPRYIVSMIAVYLSFCIMVSLGIFYISKVYNFDTLSKVLFYVSAFLTFFILLDIYNRSANYKSITFDTKSESKNKDLPDIYHIIADSHAGFDVDGLCDDYFKEELLKRGFHIYNNCKSNYVKTNLSLSSLFNMEYMHNLIKEKTNIFTPDLVLPFYINNPVFSYLKELNYKFNFVSTIGFSSLLASYCCFKGDYCFRHEFKLRNILLFSSVFFFLIRYLKKDMNYFLDPDKNFHSLINAYKNCCTDVTPRPKYNFLHLLAPHPPQYYDENGNEVSPLDYNKEEKYFGYMKYTDKKLLEVIDLITLNMKENSIILLHSDHSSLHLKKPYPILLCTLFPQKEDYECIPDNSTLVNLFKFIFNRFFNKDYKIQENRFFVSNNKDFIVKEITKEVAENKVNQKVTKD